MARQVSELSVVGGGGSNSCVGPRIVRFMCKDKSLSIATLCVSIVTIILLSQVMERLLLRKKTLKYLYAYYVCECCMSM